MLRPAGRPDASLSDLRPAQKPEQKSEQKLDWEMQKELKKNLQRLERSLKSTEDEIQKLESRNEELDEA